MSEALVIAGIIIYLVGMWLLMKICGRRLDKHLAAEYARMSTPERKDAS